jgi:voltage-gated sodium channel
MPKRLWQQRFARFVEDPRFSRTIIGLILINAVILGMETSPTLVAQYGPLLRAF